MPACCWRQRSVTALSTRFPKRNTLLRVPITVSADYIGYLEVANARNSIKPTAATGFSPGNPGVWYPGVLEIGPPPTRQ